MKPIMYKDMDFRRILGVYIFEVEKQPLVKKLIKVFRTGLSSVIKKYGVVAGVQDSVDFTFLKTQCRNDYDLFFEGIYNECLSTKETINLNWSYTININNIISLFTNYKLYYKLLQEYSVINSTYFYILAIRYLGMIKQINISKIKNLIVFSDIQPLENILVQYCNLKDIKTITLQHGLYINYKDMPNVNMLNYTNISSEYLLAWGESTEELIKSYNSEITVEICGKPISFNPDFYKRDNKLIGLVLDQPMYREYNREILQIAYEIAAKRNMKIAIRLHPQDDSQFYYYNKKMIACEANLNNASFILAHTTSMIYEYLASGIKVYKLRSSIPANDLNEFLKFSSTKELEKKLEVNFDFQKESKRYIKYIGDESKSKYNKFFENLLN